MAACVSPRSTFVLYVAFVDARACFILEKKVEIIFYPSEKFCFSEAYGI